MPGRHLVFDVNETLLDLSPLDACFARYLGDGALRPVWFAHLLHWSTVTTLTGEFLDFTDLAGRCLDALADQRGVALSETARDGIFDTIAHLPPHADVVPALETLRAAGFTLTALTNSAQKSVDTQFEHAGLSDHFEHVLSVERARHYKPHPAAYGVAADALGCDNADLCLIAAHDWDVTGALRAGCDGAFVARGGAVYNSAGTRPAILGPDLADVARQLVAAHG